MTYSWRIRTAAVRFAAVAVVMLSRRRVCVFQYPEARTMTGIIFAIHTIEKNRLYREKNR